VFRHLVVLWLLTTASAVAAAQPMVFAAASLREALDAAAQVWVEGGRPRPSISYAGSAALARQIERGAPADLFLSADEAWMDWLQARGLLRAGSRTALLGNRLVLIAPASAPAALRLAPGVALGAALGANGRLAVAETASVPAGRYARAALEQLGAWPQVAGRLAQTENVRAALALVARGEAPLGVVYETDARAEPRVRVVDTFPPGSHPPIVYPAALIASPRSARSEAFLEFLGSPAAATVFAERGFTVLAR
jgi:molybdate transport system substrate-binding protein